MFRGVGKEFCKEANHLEPVSDFSGTAFLRFRLPLSARGNAKPRNSRLQLSQSKLYLKSSLRKRGVGRYPRLIRLLLQLGHRWEIIFGKYCLFETNHSRSP